MADLAPFEPPPESLTELHTTISDALARYQQTSSPKAKSAALKEVSESSRQLANASKHPRDFHYDVIFAPQETVALRLAIGSGIFERLPPAGPATCQQLAAATGCEFDFLQRILRMVSAMGVLKEIDEDTYEHTAVSRIYRTKAAQAASKHMWDRAGYEMSQFPKYFEKNNYRSPTDHMNTPAAFAWGEVDKDYFEVMQGHPPAQDIFDDAMSATTVVSAKAATGIFPFDQLEHQFEDGVVLVDVGGGKGQMIKIILEAYPHIKGRFVLQDLKMVVAGGTIVPRDRVDVMPYDFLKEVQPVKGAAAYIFKSVFHDWPDPACHIILTNLAPAMRGHRASKLLICDIVIPDRDPPVRKVRQDINMLRISGKERSPKQFRALLEGAGFCLIKIHDSEASLYSVVEAELAE